MSQLIGSVCSYCEQVLKEKDDIVVCPVCGTPHHRACYFEHNHCFNDSLHDSDFVFTPASDKQKESTIICSHCSRVISSDCDFCNYCGAPVAKKTGQPTTPTPLFLFGAQLFRGRTERNDLEEDIDGIAIKHWVTYIGKNYNYYLNIFKLQDTINKKTSFTLSAVLFPFLYFLYRRIWGAAIISAITNLILSFPSFVVMYLVPLGIDFGFNIMTLDRLSGIFSIVNVMVNLAWGIFASWLYRKRAGFRIKKIKEGTASDMEFIDRLKQRAGTSLLATVLGVVILTLTVFSVFLVTGMFGAL